MVGNNFPKHKLIIPTLCVGMQPEPLCGSGRWSGPDWVTTQSITAIKLSVVGAGRARDDGAITLQSLCKYRGRGPLLRSVDVLTNGGDVERGNPKWALLSMESLADRLPSLIRQKSLIHRLFQTCQIDNKAVLHVIFQHALVGFVNLLDRDDFDV